MKAIRLTAPNRPLELHHIPTPAIGPKDILVKVKAAGICRSDMHYRAGVSPVSPLPMTLGHEVAGVVERVGAEVTTVTAGEPRLPALPGHLRRLRVLRRAAPSSSAARAR